MKKTSKFAALPLAGLAMCLFALTHVSANAIQQQKSSAKGDTLVKVVKSLDALYSLPPKGTVIETLDLSNQGLKELPMLKPYNIRKLNLSGNEFCINNPVCFLPSSLRELNMSNCHIGEYNNEAKRAYIPFRYTDIIWVEQHIRFKTNSFPYLQALDLSDNNLNDVYFPKHLKRLSVAGNKDLAKRKNYGLPQARNVAVLPANIQSAEVSAVPAKTDTIKLIKSLDELYSLPPKGTVIETIDLSNQNIKKLPALSPYNIKRVNLSGNDIRRIGHNEMRYLPPTVEELNLSNCHIGADSKSDDRIYLYFYSEYHPKLKVLDISNNNIKTVLFPASATRINAANCNLENVRYHVGKDKKLKYVNVSDNPNMDNTIGVPPENVDTLIHKNCARGKKLVDQGRWVEVGKTHRNNAPQWHDTTQNSPHVKQEKPQP